MILVPYRLPDGRIVQVDASASKMARTTSFTLATGVVVNATLMPPPLGHNRCDKCGRQSPLYRTFPSCRHCLEEICPECDIPHRRSEDEAHRTTCRECREFD